MAAEHRTHRIALTGGIATGKSHVRARIAAAGIPTIDADTLAREAVAPGTPGAAAIHAQFGADVFTPSGELNRKALADIVFSDDDARRQLEAIVHPAVRTATDRWFESLDQAGVPFAVADIPLLYETGRHADFERIIVTACEPTTQLARLMARDGLSEAEAQKRIAAQLPIEEKIHRATYVIRTDGPIVETDAQVDRLIDRLRREWRAD